MPTTVTNLANAGPGSLRQAILDTPAGGMVDFQPGLTGTVALTSGELVLDKDLTIAGPGSSAIRVSGNNASRVFRITTQATVVLSGLTVADGLGRSIAAAGGGIFNAGTLTVLNSTLRGNLVQGIAGSTATGRGGGIFSTGTLTVANSTVQGNSAAGIRTAQGGAIFSTGPLTVTHSILSDNSVSFLIPDASSRSVEGGAIFSTGPLTVTYSTLNGNSASGLGSMLVSVSGYGGGIYSTGPQTVMYSTLSDNSAVSNFGAASGGGIYNNGEDGTVTHSTLSGNSARGGTGGSGGGIANLGTLSVVNSTFSGNLASATRNVGLGASGGAVSTSDAGSLTVIHSTLTGNRIVSALPTNEGGGVSGRVTALHNTIVAQNTARINPDVNGLLGSLGHNLIGDGTGGSGYHPTDLVGTSDNPLDPLLGPLGDYGGPTATHALLPGSPAIDAGDNADAPETDQRGFARLVNGIVDIGAFEVQAPFAEGPVVIAQSPFRNQAPVSSLRVTFDRAIDVATFTPEDIFYFEGPLGFLAVTAVTVVPGSGDREFEITFPAQAVTGVYGLHLGPHIHDRAGHAMNQNQDELLGWSDDYYAASFGIEGPRVLRSTPSGSVGGLVEAVRLTFSVPIDPTTFTPEDVVAFLGPGGPVAVAHIAAVPGSGGTQFDVVPREPLTAAGAYRLEVWPGIYDTWGNPLDQDNDLIGGEGPEDGYVATFTIALGGSAYAADLSGLLAALLEEAQHDSRRHPFAGK